MHPVNSGIYMIFAMIEPEKYLKMKESPGKSLEK